MPYYSDELIEEVRAKSDIVDIIGSRVSLKKNGSRYVGLCPFHNEKTPSFSVTPQKQMFYCFGCHVGGNVFSFLQKYENCTFPEAMQILADRAGITLPKQEMTEGQKKAAGHREQMMAACREAGTFYYHLLRSERGKAAMDYFTGRGLSAETMQKFGLGYAGKGSRLLYDHLHEKGFSDELLRECGLVTFSESQGMRDRFWNRAIFPIMDDRSRIVAFGGRVMGDGQPKYINSQESAIFNKSYILYGMHLARRTRRKEMILCEGYMDVIALHQAGFDNAVASLGTALTEGHAAIFRRLHVQTILLSYDSDGAGIAAAIRAIPILRDAGIAVKVIDMSPFKDPDELIKARGAEEYQKRIDGAQNAILFTLQKRAQQYDMNDPDARTAFFTQEVRPWLIAMEDPLERENYERSIAQLFFTDFETLHRNTTRWIADAAVRRTTEETRPPAGVDEMAQSADAEGLSGADGWDEEELLRRRAKRRPATRAEGEQRSARILLNWLSEEPQIWKAVSPYLSAEDFEEGVYRRVAELLIAQIESGDIHPERIPDAFTDEGEQSIVAQIFNTGARMDRPQDRDKALRELVTHVLQTSSNRAVAEGAPDSLSRIIDLQKRMKEVAKLRTQPALNP